VYWTSCCPHADREHTGAQLVHALRYKPEGRGLFHRHNPSGPIMALGSPRPLISDYHDYFLGGKGGRYVGLTLPFHAPPVLKSESSNLLESSGPVRACTGIASPSQHPGQILPNLPASHERLSGRGLADGSFEGDQFTALKISTEMHACMHAFSPICSPALWPRVHRVHFIYEALLLCGYWLREHDGLRIQR
jgi:hypothetical protein